jgi:uncharacterized protein (TIGR03118 family)
LNWSEEFDFMAAISSASALPSSLVDSLQATLDRTRINTVGIVTGITSDRGAWFGASGSETLGANDPLETDDIFQIGSITKTFVATVVLQLVEAGKLSLDDTLAQRLPAALVGQIPFNDQIQIRQLLNHTSGVFNYADVLFNNATSLFNTWTAAELIAIAYDNSYFPPGTSWRYANTNYTLLGEIVEAVTGQSLSQVIRDRILTPLGMTNTFFATSEEVPSGVVNGYWDIDGNGTLNDVSFLNLTWAGASGNMVSNAQDLTKFGQALLGDSTLLTPASLQQMLTLVPTPDSNTFNGYGLGIAQLRSVTGTVYGHNGLTLGHRANLWYSPDEQLTYVDLQNTRASTNYIAPLLTTYRQELSMPVVRFTATPSTLSESENTLLTFRFELDEAPPPEGIEVTIQGNVPQNLTQLDLFALEFTGGQAPEGDLDFSGFTFKITDQVATVSVPIVQDGVPDSQVVTYTLLPGTGYTVNPSAASALVMFQDDSTPVPDQPEVSFSLSPSQLNEAQGTTLTFNFNVTGTIPPDGITVKLDGDTRNALLELLGTEVEFESATETELEFFPDNLVVKGGTLGAIDPDFASFTFTITEANASIALKVFDDIFEEGTETFKYTLAEAENDRYTVSATANSGTYTIVDGVPGGVGPVVGITANQTALYEDEGTKITLSLNVSGTIPTGGLVVFIDSTQGYGSTGALGQFDVFNLVATGGTVVGVDEDASGFYFRITQPNATITVPIFADSDVEAPTPYTFSLIDGEQYQVNASAKAVSFTLADGAPFNILTDTAKVDYIAGSNGKDAIYGLDGFNSLYGNGGNDVIIGGRDGDLIFGGDGNDLIVGRQGSDVLFGGAGVDTFAFSKGDGGQTIADLNADIISDFKVGEDKIGVIKGSIAPSDIAFEQKDTATLVKVKSSGEVLAWLQNVTATSLNASSVVEVTNQPITPNNTYAPTVLVSNRQEYNPQIYDPTFALGWGLAIRPAGAGGHFWVTANGSGASYEYVGDVNIGKPNAVPLFQDDLKLVMVPGPDGTQGTPTGTVFNGSNNFVITQDYAGGTLTAPSRFLFATDSGTISAWTERKNPDGSFDRSLTAKIVIDRSKRGDQYFGLAVNPTGDRLYVANFGVNPNVQVFDGTFQDITTSFNGFANPFVGNDGFQAGEYAPFNIQVLEAPNKTASVFVAYAKTQEDPNNPGQLFVGEEEAGPGLGRVAEFDLSGQLIRTWNDNGLLNSPWGFAYAPNDFGGLSNTLLVSNFSDGTIAAFDTTTGNAIDYLRDTTGQPSVQRGIWGILFGNGVSLGDTNSLYAAVGPEDIGDGIFSRLNYVNLGNSSSPSATPALLQANPNLPLATSLASNSPIAIP